MFVRTIQITLLAILLALAPLSSSSAQPSLCMPHKKLAEHLNGKFKEKLVSFGVASGNKILVQLYLSKIGSWTIAAVNPNGMSCVVTVGNSWTQAPETLNKT